METPLTVSMETVETSLDPAAPTATVLYESGVNLVCMLTRKPAGTRLRRWLAREVLPSLRASGGFTLEGAAPATRPAAQRPRLSAHDGMALVERALALAPDAEPIIREAWVSAALSNAGLAVPTLSWVKTRENGQEAAGFAQPGHRDKIRDEPVPRALPATEEPAEEINSPPALPPVWLSASEIARQDGGTPSTVGRLASQLGLRDPDRADVRIEHVSIGGRQVAKYYYSGSALRVLRTEVLATLRGAS